MKATHKATIFTTSGAMIFNVVVVEVRNGKTVVQEIRGGKSVGPTFFADKIEAI
jgi:hypothetical protein